MRCVRILGTVYQNEIQADRSRTLQGVLLTKFAKLALLIAILSLNLATAAAQTLTGTVTNGTTGKPAAGLRFQADSGTMQGIRLFVVSNTSSPPKTQMNDHNFEFYLPAGAKIEQLQARSLNGQPISADA